MNFLYSALVGGRGGRCSFWPVQGEQLGVWVERGGRWRRTWWVVCLNLEPLGWPLREPAVGEVGAAAAAVAAAAAACYWA